MTSFATIAAYSGLGIGIANSGVGLTNLWRGTREATRSEQRKLRQRLREILMDAAEVCEKANFEIEHNALPRSAPPELREASRRIQALRREGVLLSPNDTHLDLIHKSIRRAWNAWYDIQTAFDPGDVETLSQSQAELKLRNALGTALTRIEVYLLALAAMDNGSYPTYRRFKRIRISAPDPNIVDLVLRRDEYE